MNKNIKVNPDGTISPIDPSKPSSFGEPDNAMAGELDSFKYFLRYLQAMPDVDKYALAPEQVDAIAVKVIILLENERTRLLESLQRELPEKRTIDNDHDYTDNTFNKGVNHAIQEVNQLLTKYVQGGK